MTMYHDVLMDHYRNPRNHGCSNCLTNSSSHMHNPSCGDKILLKVMKEDGIVKDICFEGYGCALSTAAASMLTEYAKGKKVKEMEKMTIDELKKLLAIDVSTAREKCARLPLDALHEALKAI